MSEHRVAASGTALQSEQSVHAQCDRLLGDCITIFCQLPSIPQPFELSTVAIHRRVAGQEVLCHRDTLDTDQVFEILSD